MKKYTLITGASSGIGLEMAKILAAEGNNLILVARSRDKLEQLKSELEPGHNIEVKIITKDLSVYEETLSVYDECNKCGYIVNVLINNAGFGLYGEFADTPLEDEIRMVSLNINAVLVLTKLFIKDMKERKEGKILNLASLLSFLPFPYYSVYSATKTFVLSFSETLAAELKGTGVAVLSLCPGPVDTNFSSPEMLATKAYSINKPADPQKVAQAGVNLLRKGKGKKIVGFNNWFISNLPRITPDFIMMKIKKNLAKPNLV
ncbi:SDR family NAD(P)-dependent oxidoreductase [Flavobacterium cyanobacteriorum]|nr:SDR family oxidoreductase [Flavobacterium cyanobacteriorum]